MISNKEFNSKTCKVKIEEYTDFRRGKPFGIVFKFYTGNKLIGDMYVDEYNPCVYNTHSNLIDWDLQGRGLGLYMYGVVIDWCMTRGLALYSSPIFAYSPDADRIWRSKRLRKRYVVKKARSRWRVFGGRSRVMEAVSGYKVLVGVP